MPELFKALGGLHTVECWRTQSEFKVNAGMWRSVKHCVSVSAKSDLEIRQDC